MKLFNIFKKNKETVVSSRSEKDDYNVKSTRKVKIIIAIISLFISIILWLYVVGITTTPTVL